MKYFTITNPSLIAHSDDQHSTFEAADKLFEEIKPIIEKYGFKPGALTTHCYPNDTFKIEKCASCSSWTIDRETTPERESIDEQIRDGAIHNQKLLCEECLPSNHKWAW